MTGSLIVCGYASNMAMPYYLVTVGGTCAHLAWQLRTVDLDSTASCSSKFVSNKWLGLIVFLGTVAGRYFAEESVDDDSADVNADTMTEKKKGNP